MSSPINAHVGQALMSLGLYGVAFESMALSFRAALVARMNLDASDLPPAFKKACKTAADTFDYCCPRLVEWGVLTAEDVDRLSAMRERRNYFAHEGYNEALTLTVADVKADVELMLAMTRKSDMCDRVQVDSGTKCDKPEVGVRIPFRIAPAAFQLYLMAAESLATSELRVEVDGADA